jgi:hypothetical protein
MPPPARMEHPLPPRPQTFDFPSFRVVANADLSAQIASVPYPQAPVCWTSNQLVYGQHALPQLPAVAPRNQFAPQPPPAPVQPVYYPPAPIKVCLLPVAGSTSGAYSYTQWQPQATQPEIVPPQAEAAAYPAALPLVAPPQNNLTRLGGPPPRVWNVPQPPYPVQSRPHDRQMIPASEIDHPSYRRPPHLPATAMATTATTVTDVGMPTPPPQLIADNATAVPPPLTLAASGVALCGIAVDFIDSLTPGKPRSNRWGAIGSERKRSRGSVDGNEYVPDNTPNSFGSFVRSLLEHTLVSRQVVVLALFYATKIAADGEPSSERLFLGCLMVASKVRSSPCRVFFQNVILTVYCRSTWTITRTRTRPLPMRQV